MSSRIIDPLDRQVDTINRNSPFVQQSLDLVKQDKFATSFAVDFVHYKAMISPIGKKDRGDYRRSDGVDTVSSNGMIYKCAGTFSATMTDNSRSQKRTEGGIADPSESRLVLPRFYNKDALSDGKRIYLAPGDRVYIADPNADVRVSNYHEMDFMDGENIPMFPIVCMEQPIIDSRNIEYTENVDFSITKAGNILWLPTGKNPGIDPTTGKGRVYSIRYLYNAHWYVTVIPKEIRITNVTSGGVRTPERMPYHAIVVREYIFHEQNRGDQKNQLKSKNPKRVQEAPVESITPDRFTVPVDMSAIGDEEAQS